MVTNRRELSDIRVGRRATSSKVVRLPNPPLVAIIDDDEAVREALFDLLQVEGLSAKTYVGAATFMEEFAPGRFDCIITDVRMPEIDGIELQRRLRALGASIPVIFITSTTDAVIRARAERDGSAAWFTKPVADDDLLNALRAVLEG